ncbi:DpnII family type II restriction endonuclease [Croceicoccus sp. F390]|uniref:DpnII family type II restriction endonuclease n=1 Tax=Croceicoccus esteveae TaxID=3075597 RepID=A0ABU2ZLB3_9SPHN|nr:DpnII family type II restriction endonuclease [Croceicoccus sp. F390]MDT0577155.1 DpnII family type II restriction endonuclease [Croceicoccus sp. F390]
MQVRDQTLDEIKTSLSPLTVDWMDDAAREAMALLAELPVKESYDRNDVAAMLDQGFDRGILCARLFLMMSKDSMTTALTEKLPTGGIGAKRYKAEREAFLDALDSLGLPMQMAATINYQPVWSDILKERLRSGRGSAIQGQKRGRGLEDFTEVLVREVFGDSYETRCTFTGADGKTAKCDIAIPDRNRPRIVIEVKGYNATGSKMTDIIGDLDAIIDAKRHDTTLMFVTDGSTWAARLSDLKKIIDRQNQGKIARIYTTKMQAAFLDDLQSLKGSMGL